MQDYYAARAAEYDRVYAKPERQADLRAIEKWLPPLFEGSTVLEVACGTGWWTRFIAPVAARVVAIDAAPETMRIAEQRVPRGKVRFVVGDAYALPRTGDVFDAAFAGFWLSHVAKARAREFLLGLHAALAPGARVVFLDNRYAPGSSSPISERDGDGNTYQERRLANGAVHRVLKNFPSQAELRALVEDLGTGVTYTQWPHYWALTYRARTPDNGATKNERSHTMLDTAALQKLIEPLFPGLMGVRFVELAAERITGELDVTPALCTTGGILHGGAYMAFADTLGAVGTLVNLAPDKRTTTTDSSTKFIAGARVGTKVRGESVALHRGRTTMVWQTSITNSEGKLCAVVTQTQLVLDARP